MAKAIRIGHQISNGIKITTKRFLMAVLLLPQDEIEKLFKDAKWEEIQDVQNVGYEVEKVTYVAGVRGNEAEHEILDFLYYRVRSNTPQIPSKLAEKLHIR